MRDHRLRGRFVQRSTDSAGQECSSPPCTVMSRNASTGRSIGGDLESKRDESVPVRKRNPDRYPRRAPRRVTRSRRAFSRDRKRNGNAAYKLIFLDPFLLFFFFSLFPFCNCRAQPAWRHILRRRATYGSRPGVSWL